MTRKWKQVWRRLGVALTFCVPAITAHAAAFPEKQIKLVVPYAPGGAADQLGRALAERMRMNLGQVVVVENKPGANTIVAATQVARAAPDGYTLLLASNASMVLNPQLYARIAYDGKKDYRVVALAAELPLVVVTNKEVPATTLDQFVAYARQNPGKLNYASVGIGNPLQLATELLKSRTGIDVAHIPFNGSAPALTSLMSNDTQLMIDVISTSLPLIKDGKLQALAVTTSERINVLPNVPTVAESGFPGFRAATWFGIAVPRSTPDAVVDRLRAAVDSALSEPAFREQFEALGLVIQAPRTPAQIDTYVEEDRARWSKVIEDNHIKLE